MHRLIVVCVFVILALTDIVENMAGSVENMAGVQLSPEEIGKFLVWF